MNFLYMPHIVFGIQKLILLNWTKSEARAALVSLLNQILKLYNPHLNQKIRKDIKILSIIIIISVALFAYTFTFDEVPEKCRST